MENKKGSEIFLGVVGVTTLVVAIIGATFAYFSANASSANEAIAVHSTTVELGFKDDAPNGLKTNMIPSTKNIAKYAAFNETWISGGQVEFSDGEMHTAPGKCIDENTNEICSVYEFWVGNPAETGQMEIVGSINVVTNEFTNLMFAIYDETGAEIVTDTFAPSGESMEIDELNQVLVGNPDVKNKPNATFDTLDPTTYNPLLDMSLAENAGKQTNVRHYKMLIWINETGSNQKEEDASKIFAAGITFSTGGDNAGVTGTIAAAG